MQSPRWYLNRMSTMSVKEISHRLRKDIVGRLERVGAFGTKGKPPKITNVAPWIGRDVAMDGVGLAAEAERILSNRFPIFGLSEGLKGASIEWNRDPLTGTLVPLLFGKSLDYRAEEIVGNIKYLWEPNRHLELVTLAQAYVCNGDRRFLDGISDRISSWLEQCPYQMGPNWSSSLELGIRLINWSIVWDLLGGLESPLFSGAEGVRFRDQWLTSIYQHIQFIDGHYSRFSSANNHVIGEAAGVYIATCVWPFWSEFEAVRSRARTTLLDECARQTHVDGVNKEQAISYQQFVLDFLLFAGLAGERCQNDVFPDHYWGRIDAMIGYIGSLMDVAGNMPMIGDADDGYVTRIAVGDFCPYRSLLATGAIRFGRPDYAKRAGRLDSKTKCLMGESACSDFDNLLAAESDDITPPRSFPSGGYFILGRKLGTAEELKIVVDSGPLGYLSIAAHGHADALNMMLSVAGREILVDPGTYSYHTDRRWRDYFRGTSAHNTVRIDGEDQSVQGGNFMWLKHANAQCKKFEYDDANSFFSGEHNGYSRLSDPVLHGRDILQRGTMIEVTDRLGCEGYHVVERCWQFSEHCRVSLEGATVVAENGPVRVTLRPLESATEVRKFRGSEDPPRGWISRRFDVKEPTESVYFVNEIRGAAELKTRIECEIGFAGSVTFKQGE